jgi:S1-C subfamily serine protease
MRLFGALTAGLAWMLCPAICLPGNGLPADIPVPADFQLPAAATAAIYLPASQRKAHMNFQGVGGIQSGETLEEVVVAVAPVFFKSFFVTGSSDQQHYGLLIALHPEIKADGPTLTYTMHYRVLAPDGHELMKGDKASTFTFGAFRDGSGDLVGKLSERAIELALADVIGVLRPDDAKFPASGALVAGSLHVAVNHDKPWATGTGFFINEEGQVMTAAHVVQECESIEIQRGDQAYAARPVAASNLLDVAVLDSDVHAEKFVSFRRSGEFELGESVTSAGFPLQPVMAATPNLTRGNISSRAGLSGSVGDLQFSAPIQPGSSGGPLVSEGGELLGVTVGTLNYSALVSQGVLPQNVNFALDARYAARFLRNHNLKFHEVETNPKGDLHTATDAALSVVVGVKCYQ